MKRGFHQSDFAFSFSADVTIKDSNPDKKLCNPVIMRVRKHDVEKPRQSAHDEERVRNLLQAIELHELLSSCPVSEAAAWFVC